jgi:hypothetical protein
VHPSAATGNHNDDEHNDDNRAARNHEHHTGTGYHATTGGDHD